MAKKIDLKAQMQANRKAGKANALLKDAAERRISRARDAADEYVTALDVAGGAVVIAAAAACVMAGGDGAIVMVARGLCDDATAKAAIAEAQTAVLYQLGERLVDARSLPRPDREAALLCAVDLIRPRTADDVALLETIAGPLGFSAMRYVG